MKTRYFLLIFLLFFLIVGCSNKDQVTPNEIFDKYTKEWHDGNFDEMYSMLTSNSVQSYPVEEFIDRYQKVYSDLNISNLNISYERLDEEALEIAFKEEQATFPFSITMDSVAGPIHFNYHAIVYQELIDEEDKEKEWVLSWDPGFIFPALKDGGKIVLNSNSPIRGEIFDRNKMPLAINDFIYEIGIVPGEMRENEDTIKEQVSELLDISIEKIDSLINQSWVQPDHFVPIKKTSKTNKELIDDLMTIDSIVLRDVEGRTYPLGEAAAHLIGYIGPITADELEKKDSTLYSANDIIGKRGIEQLYEEQLKGIHGLEIIITSEDKDDVVLAKKPVEHGDNITLTIDGYAQTEIYESYEGEAGTTTAINPKTGETLALVSSPAFDPNEWSYGITRSRKEEVQNDPKEPTSNRFAAKYAPGSVIKPVTASIGLKNDIIDPKEGIEIDGYTWSNDKSWGDYKVRRVSQSTQPVDLADALIRSDNIYFAMKSLDIGSESLIDGFKQFGFEEKIPFEYPIQNSTISSSGELESEVEIVNTSYGQAQIETSSLHLALMYSTFLNEGSAIKPTLLLDTETEQFWLKDIISAEDANMIKDILRDVVTTGTGKTALRQELDISGKTGTVELKKTSGARGKENGWFIGYPTEDEDILIAMLIQHTENLGTSAFAADKAADILLKMKLATEHD